jgi:hypothetical protein
LNRAPRYLGMECQYSLNVGQWLMGYHIVIGGQGTQLHVRVAVSPGAGAGRSSIAALLLTVVPGTSIQRTCSISLEFGRNFMDPANSTAASQGRFK